MLGRSFVKVTLLLVFFLTFFSEITYSFSKESINLMDSTESINLNDYIEILEDERKAWTIEDVSSEEFDNQFHPYYKGIPNFGYSSSAYWVRFQVNNTSMFNDWLLEIDNSTMDYISLYFSTNSMDYKEGSYTGDLLPFEERDVEHRNFIFRLEIPKEESMEIYLRFESEGAMQLPLTLWHPDEFIKKAQIEYSLLGIFFGFTIIMVIYNLFLYFSLRSRSYLYYVLFIVSNIFIHLAFTGAAYQYIWPEYSWWNNRSIVFFMAMSSIIGLLFAKSFLDTKKYVKKLDDAMSYLAIGNFFIIILLFINYPIALTLVVVGTGVAAATIILAALLCYGQGYRPSRYFLLAWHVSIIGTVISLLADSGIIPLNFGTKYAWQLTFSIEFILLSFALADKINTMRKEKEVAEKDAVESHKLALESLKRTDKLKDEFLASTSHELRTPLNGIIGIAESMYDGAVGPLNKPSKHHLSMIIKSGQRLSHLIDDLLDFSKLKNNSLEINAKKVHLKDITEVVLSICQSLVKNKSIVLINKVDSKLPPIYADGNRIQQILYNLVGNGIKYTESGHVCVDATLEGNMVCVLVSDTGIGISEEFIDEIFLPFHQGNNQIIEEYSGTGIGLSITKRLVELHNGKISCHSKIEQGSVFQFTLPIYQEEIYGDGDEVAATAPPSIFNSEADDINDDSPILLPQSKKGSKILIADDEPINLQILVDQLSLHDYEVDTVFDGVEAVDRVNKQDGYDLLILDVMMPKMSGYEVCRTLRKHYSLTKLPILMLTAKNQMEDRVTAFEMGANDYLTKPANKNELLSRVQTLVNMKKAMSEVEEHAVELDRINQELFNVNENLEEKVKLRTKELQRTNRELEKANEGLMKMEESRKHLLSNISHELGTPITYLQSYIQSVQAGIIEANNSRYLESVQNKIKMLDRLIQDLFDLAKFESGKNRLNIERRDLKEWLNQVYGKFELDVQKSNLNFKKQIIYELEERQNISIFIDTDRIDQVFSNLIYNAIKHTGPGGEISIIAHVNVENLSKFQNDDFDGEVVIEIADNGSGIKEEDIPYLFNRFYKGTSKTSNGGTGLGLAITKEIILYHKGKIWVESEESIGSSFYFSLPIELSQND
ncbi:ATP-binding protein [Evansella sp. AB-P1]|uniref:ATP-binding protein n=1 Tax=Evansella sp. AB-P1 TaxID=3037653 RepID=UPI00241D9CD4|nr:ATP-binding protein [Evansella sp. AB-P1]MDG5786029.1 ATP-binding protein [Evansella sp. AB-P1]